MVDIDDFEDIEEAVEDISDADDAISGKDIDWLVKRGIKWLSASEKDRASEERRARKEQRDEELHASAMERERMRIAKLQKEIVALDEKKNQSQAVPAPADADINQQVIYGELPLSPVSPQFESPDNPEEFNSFLHQLETYPTSMVILGTRGYGKSALAHAILEYLRFKTNKPAYILLAPRTKKHILPNWLQIVDEFDDVAPNSLLLVDEAGLILNSRSSQKRINRSFIEVNALLRQKGVTMIFVSQTSKTIDVNAFQVGDLILVWKKPNEMALSFERGFVKESGKNAMKLFKTIPKDDLKRYSVVGYDGESSILMTNGLASYWNEDVSCMYGQASDGSESRTEQIKRLHTQGMLQKDIASKLNVSEAYVSMVMAGKK